jgi:uncharacterized LabA/DUF88 family protein
MTAPQLEKTALFIDGANLYATAKSLGFDIDYKRLLREFQSRGYLMRAFYYTAVIEDQEYSSIRPLIDWLDYNGYSVVTKATKEFVDQTGRRKVKGNMDIELAVDAMELAEHIDHMVLFSGDGDFSALVEAMQRARRPGHRGLHHFHPAPHGRPTSCAGRLTSSSTSSSCSPRLAATRQNVPLASRASAIRNFCSAAQRRSVPQPDRRPTTISTTSVTRRCPAHRPNPALQSPSRPLRGPSATARSARA